MSYPDLNPQDAAKDKWFISEEFRLSNEKKTKEEISKSTVILLEGILKSGQLLMERTCTLVIQKARTQTS